MSELSPYTVLVAEYDKSHYVDCQTEKEALNIADSEISKHDIYTVIAYYWDSNFDCYFPLLEKKTK